MGRGCCKAGLQDLSLAEPLYGLSWAVSVQQPLCERFRAFLGRGCPGAGDLHPLPATGPLPPRYPNEASALLPHPQSVPPSWKACPSQTFLYSKSYSKRLALSSRMQSARCLSLSHDPDTNLAWEAEAQVPEEVARAWGVAVAQLRCSICLHKPY